MNYLINQLMTVDKAFYRHYLEMLLTLNRIQALTPWQMSMLLWRAKIFHIQVLYPELLRISLCTEQERNAIFGEIILGYVIFEEASLKTNGSH
jgi:serine acetyltransferase